MPGDSQRSITLHRDAFARFTATNSRGGTLTFGEGDSGEFSPIELLLAAIAGCTAIDVDYITNKRTEPTQFDLEMTADKVRDDNGNHLTNMAITFRVRFPEGAAGDAAREMLPIAVQRSHDRLCTVSRTVELGAPITVEIA